MKKRMLLLLPLCVLLAAAWGLAAGGEDDPLATLSYLTGTFSDIVDDQVERRLDESDAVLTGWDGIVEQPAEESASVWQETRLKAGDVLSGPTGAGVLLLAGGMRVTYSSGAVVDVTSGAEISSGTALSANHRYMVAEDTWASFEVTSKTAVADYQGGCSLSFSDAADYNAAAFALKRLNLFQGGPTGYGQGFALEAAPTRLQAIIMFIRILGEEEEALTWTGTMPFSDIAAGSLAEKYVGYAYERGYTNGYGSVFRPSRAVSASQYMEFILRAMGYSSAANTNLSDALERAQAAGILTAGEADILRSDHFLRADLAYVSYYALEAPLPDGGQTLGELLMEKGVFTEEDWDAARDLVPGWRL